jgi:hypothetical protein
MRARRLRCGLLNLLALAGLFLPLVSRSQVSFRAELSQTRARVGERVTLTVSLEGNIDANAGVDLPDLSPYFRIEDQSGPSMSTQMSIVNGKMSRKTSVQYQYVLLAAKAGRFKIPQMVYRQGAQSYYTSPVQVEILDASAPAESGPPSSRNWAPDSDPYLRLELDKKEVFVGEQVKASWYLYFQRNLLNLKLGAPPQLADFKALDLEKVSRLAPVEKNFRGMPWNAAFLQSMALYPVRSGKATVGALELRFQGPGNPRDFFGGPFGREESVASEPASITVKALPEPAPQDFTGAVGKFEVKSHISKNEARSNESLQFQVEIFGDGNPDYILEPKLVLPPDFEIYPPEVKVETSAAEGRLVAIKKFGYVVVAKRDGEFTLPGVGFRYFDPLAGEYKYAESSPVAVKIYPGASPGPAASPGTAAPKPALSEDIRYIKPDQKSLPDQSAGIFGKGWFWLIHLSGLLLVGLALFYRAYQERLTSDQVFARRLRAPGQAKKRLRKAAALSRDHKAREFSAELKRALLEYFGDRFCVSPWGLLEDDMAEVMRKEGVPEELAKEFLGLFSALSRAQFAGKIEDSDFGKMVEQSEKIIAAMEKTKK